MKRGLPLFISRLPVTLLAGRLAAQPILPSSSEYAPDAEGKRPGRRTCRRREKLRHVPLSLFNLSLFNGNLIYVL